jgi:hypothetical protein
MISVITIANLGIIMMLTFHAYLIFHSAQNTNSSFIGHLLMFAVILFGLRFFCLALFYVFARIGLVVESFFSLAFLPASVCTTPNFSLYFPISDKWSASTPDRLHSRSQGIPSRRLHPEYPKAPGNPRQTGQSRLSKDMVMYRRHGLHATGHAGSH